MLNDRGRNMTYQAAITAAVAGGCRTVLDLGAGTGLLSLMAARAGAERVQAVEAGEAMALTCSEVLRANPEGARVTLVAKLSTDMEPSEVAGPVDLLVTETFDAGLLGEGVLASLAHAWAALLTPGHSRVLPAAARLLVAPVQCSEVAAATVLDTPALGYLATNGFRLTSDSTEPYTTADLAAVGHTLLAPPATLLTVNLEDPLDIQRLLEGEVVSLSFPVAEGGRVDGMAGWFELEVGAGRVRTAPGAGGCWEQAVFPPPAPRVLRAAAGDTVQAEFLVRGHARLQDLQVLRADRGAAGGPGGGGGAGAGVNGGALVNGGAGVNGSDEATVSNGTIGTSGGAAAQGPPEPSEPSPGPRAPGGARRHLQLPPSSLRLLACPASLAAAQWLAYRLAAPGAPQRLLHTAPSPPLAALQLLQLLPSCRLTLAVEPGRAALGRQLLDWVAAVAAANRLDTAAIDCIAGAPGAGAGYTAALVEPVAPSGRLDQEVRGCTQEHPSIKTDCLFPKCTSTQVLEGLGKVQASLAHGGLLLPHKVCTCTYTSMC